MNPGGSQNNHADWPPLAPSSTIGLRKGAGAAWPALWPGVSSPIATAGRVDSEVERMGGAVAWAVVADSDPSGGYVACRRARSASVWSSEEVTLNWNKWVRQTHRWLSIAFTVAVIVNIVAVVQGKYTFWMGLLAVFPLALLLFTGLYLFVLPYAAKWRSGRTRLNGRPAARKAASPTPE